MRRTLVLIGILMTVRAVVARCPVGCRQLLTHEAASCRASCPKRKPGKRCRAACAAAMRTSKATCKATTNPTPPDCGATTTSSTTTTLCLPPACAITTTTLAMTSTTTTFAGTTTSTTLVGAVNRDRLLASYLAYLRSEPTKAQSNGLRGAELNTVCDLWAALDPSSRATFLTITARLDGSLLVDNSTMLDHVTALYRATGGQGATATDPGTCGGNEYNRLLMSMDAQLHAALVAANANHGGVGTGGRSDLLDIPVGGFWRDSHDLGGPKAPFDVTDETNDGPPRGQLHYFQDPASTLANSPLGRLDLETLVDPYALDVDQYFDCVHNGNPQCAYTSYGPMCSPEPTSLGTDIDVHLLGDFDATWQPAGCP